MTSHSAFPFTFRSLIVSTCLLTAGLIAAPANAQQQFTPASAWSVDLVSGSDASLKTCRIQSEYNNGYVLSFTGQNGKVSGLNIDFRQNIFDVGTSYDVALQSNNGVNAKRNARAISSTALLIPVTHSLSNANYVDATIEGNTFRFGMNGLSGAVSQFQSCSASSAPITVQSPQATTTVSALNETAPVPLVAPAPRRNVVTAPAPIFSAPIFTAPTNTSRSMIGTSQTLNHSAQNSRVRMSDQLAAQLSNAQFDFLPKERRFNTAATQSLVAPVADFTVTPPLPSSDISDMISVKPATVSAAPISMPRPSAVHSSVFKKPEPAKPYIDPIMTKSAEAVVPTSNVMSRSDDAKALELKVARLENDLAVTKMEKKQISEELELSLTESRDETISISSENWDLERATMRYNEAERQVKRLAQQVQKEKARCTSQIKEMEMLLFDPELTEKEQLGKLAELEDKLFDAEEELTDQRRKYEERIRVLEERLSAQ